MMVNPIEAQGLPPEIPAPLPHHNDVGGILSQRLRRL